MKDGCLVVLCPGVFRGPQPWGLPSRPYTDPPSTLLLLLLLPLQYEYLVREKIADGSLIAKWRKPGYDLLCSMLAIQKGNHNFGTTSHCRVPICKRGAQQRITPDVQTGCISCASGDGK